MTLPCWMGSHPTGWRNLGLRSQWVWRTRARPVVRCVASSPAWGWCSTLLIWSNTSIILSLWKPILVFASTFTNLCLYTCFFNFLCFIAFLCRYGAWCREKEETGWVSRSSEGYNPIDHWKKKVVEATTSEDKVTCTGLVFKRKRVADVVAPITLGFG